MKLHFSRKKILIIIFILIVSIFLFKITNNQNQIPNPNNFILLRDDLKNESYKEREIEFDLVEPDKDGGYKFTYIDSFSFPYEHPFLYTKKLNNLIGNKDGYNWLFFEYTDSSSKWLCMKISFDNIKKKMNFKEMIVNMPIIYENQNQNGVYFDSDSNYIFPEMDSMGEKILTYSSCIINIKDCKMHFLPELCDDKGIFNKIDMGSAFINDNEIITQSISEVESYTGYFEKSKSYISIVNLNGTLKKQIQKGYGKISLIRSYYFPIDVSIDSSKAAFTFYNDLSSENNRMAIGVLNLINNNIEELSVLPENSTISTNRWNTKCIIKWCPVKEPHLMALANFSNEILIVDVEKKGIIKKLNFEVKSLRWSPDGKKIGFLSREGKMYVYNLEKDSLDKISEDSDYFDFFWVNQEKKNSMEKTLRKVTSFFGK